MRATFHSPAAILAVLAVVWPAASRAFDATARGRELTRLFFTSQLDSLHETFDARMSQVLKVADLATFRNQVDQQMGSETRLVEESAVTRDSLQVYTRLANFERVNGLIEVTWTLDPNGKVAGFYVRPPQGAHASKYDEYQTKTPLRLPFSGTWFVFWGGRTLRENYHASAPDQRFAYDIVIRKGDSTHDGDGTSNAQYYAFGQPLVAPGAGKVIEAVDGIADNTPGVMNRDQPLGNHVILDHGNGEFSFVAHLQKGSLTVRTGQKVKAGDALGACGNSGNSSEPHLHYHMQTTGVPFKGEGLPAQFLNYVANGQKVARGEPHQTESVEQP